MLYNETSLQSVLDLTKEWTLEEMQMLRNKVGDVLLMKCFIFLIIDHFFEFFDSVQMSVYDIWALRLFSITHFTVKII